VHQRERGGVDLSSVHGRHLHCWSGDSARHREG
jgi:hypothetical protein